MTAVPVDIQTRRPLEPTKVSELEEVMFVGDWDEIVETTMCSCNAGDDNPY
jgi:hypothetical protein